MDIKDLEMWALTDGRLSSVKVTAEDSANARDLSRLKAPKPGSQAVFFFLDKIRSYFMYKNTLFSSTKQTWTTSVQGHSQRIWRQGSKLYFLGLFAYSFNLFFCIFFCLLLLGLVLTGVGVQLKEWVPLLSFASCGSVDARTEQLWCPVRSRRRTEPVTDGHFLTPTPPKKYFCPILNKPQRARRLVWIIIIFFFTDLKKKLKYRPRGPGVHAVQPEERRPVVF